MAIPYISEQPDGDAKQKIQRLETIYRSALTVRQKRELEWRQNILFLRGYQWEDVVNTPRGTRRIERSAPHSKVKMTSNQIYPLARQAASHLVDNISQPIAIASTSEQEDVLAAELATDLLVYRQSEDNEVEIRRDETLWAMCCGLVMRLTIFDPDKDSLLDGNIRIFGAGDIDTISLNPWQFILSPWARSPRDSEFLILPDVQPIEKINDTYGSDVQSEDVVTEDWLLEKDMMGLIVDSHGAGRGGFVRPDNAAILKRMYVRPTRQNRKGQMFVWANGELLQEGELPEGEMPLEPISWWPAPGSPYPMAFITPLIDQQKEINVNLSQLIELKNRQLRGDLLVRGTSMPTEEETHVTETIDENSGRKTVYADATVQDMKFMEYNLDVSTAEWLIAHIYNDMMQDAGIHESSLGKQQPSGTPATTTLALKESDLSGLTVFRSGFDLAHAKIARQKLIIARNHYKVPRMLRIVGENNAVATDAFLGSDLRTTEDVRPRTEPMLTEAEKNVIRTQLIGQGAYGPYEGPKHKLAMVRIILTSGLPEARDEAERVCAPMSIEELEQIVGEIDAIEAQLTVAQAQAMLDQATGANEEQPDAGMGDVPPEMQAVMGMQGGMANGQV